MELSYQIGMYILIKIAPKTISDMTGSQIDLQNSLRSLSKIKIFSPLDVTYCYIQASTNQKFFLFLMASIARSCRSIVNKFKSMHIVYQIRKKSPIFVFRIGGKYKDHL